MQRRGTKGERRLLRTAGVSSSVLGPAACLAALIAAACDSTTRTSVAPSPAEKCGVTLAASATSFGTAGGEGTLAVTTTRDCSWTVSSAVPWIALPGGASGQGSATVRFVVSPNTEPAARSGALQAGTASVTIAQQPRPCAFELSSREESVPSEGGVRTVDVRATSAACDWTARSGSAWITIQSGREGRGNGRVTFAAAASGGPPRTGSLEIAGQPVTVRQGDGCDFTVDPTALALPSAGGTVPLAITTAAGCAWTIEGGAEWAGVAAAAAGAGPATVQVTVSPNAGPARSSSLLVAGRTVSITQASGCAYTVSPPSVALPGGGGSTPISIATAPGCPWSAASSASWLSVTSPASGSGASTLQLSATANLGPARSATLNVAGRAVSVSQASACTYAVSPSAISRTASGGPAAVSVSTAPGCPWTAVSQAAWIAVASGASGSGSGVTNLSIDRNSGPLRTGTVVVATQTIGITQAGGCQFELSASSLDIGPAGGISSFQVTTENGCRWHIVMEGGAGWVSLPRGLTGNGSGPVVLVIAPNFGPARTARLLIEGQPFTIRQSGR